VKLLCVENTHNIGGGYRSGLWNRSKRSLHGLSEARYSAAFDTVSVCFSKALGVPVGSCLAGPKTFIARARRFKQQFGGGFRQAGIIAAGALYALELIEAVWVRSITALQLLPGRSLPTRKSTSIPQRSDSLEQQPEEARSASSAQY
jgi:threonine aldolase